MQEWDEIWCAFPSIHELIDDDESNDGQFNGQIQAFSFVTSALIADRFRILKDLHLTLEY